MIFYFHSIMFCFTVACELALYLGEIVKSRHARGTREETRTQGGGGENNPNPRPLAALPLTRASRAARCAHPNRRACSQASFTVDQSI